jgi:hypothetical protein
VQWRVARFEVGEFDPDFGQFVGWRQPVRGVTPLIRVPIRRGFPSLGSRIMP